jgi:outer membrane protein assembly factor BamB
MKKMLVGIVTLVLVATAVLGQPGTFKVYTRPSLPSTEALERMGLKLAWASRILLRGDRDGYSSVQLLHGAEGSPVGNQVLVQSYSGLVALFDGETGDQLWQTQVGTPFRVSQPAGYNSHSIFLTRRNILYILNRATGAQRIYTADKLSGVRTYGVELPYGPSAAPVAEEDALYLVMSMRVMALALPAYQAADRLVKAGAATPEATAALFPETAWTYLIGDEFAQFPALVAGNQLTVATAEGTLLSLKKFRSETDREQLRYRFETEAKVVAPMGQHGWIAYAGTDAGTLYAYNMDTAKLQWRFLPGGGIRRQPAVTDRDVFVAVDQVGLFRLDRATGREVWVARQLDRFLAANDNFVYALHHTGEFHVLDYLRGSTMARYDLKDWTIPVLNELTDRIYLASNDGQLICLRHRDLRAPLRNKTIEQPAKEEKKAEKVEEKKEDKKEEKQEEEKKPEKKDSKAAEKMTQQRPPIQHPVVDALVHRPSSSLSSAVTALAGPTWRQWLP